MSHEQVRDVMAIEKLMNKELPLSEHSEERRPVAAVQSGRPRQGGRGYGGGGGNRSGGGRGYGGSNSGGGARQGYGRPSRFGPSEGSKNRRPQVSFE